MNEEHAHQPDHSHNVIEVKDVTFGYTKHDVLKDVTFNVHKGDYLGIIGPNGGGKTTLLRVILGLLTPSKGTIKLFGTEESHLKHRSRIGYVPQKATSFDVNFPVTVREVVEMGRYAKKGLLRNLTHHDQQLIDKALEDVDMQDFHNRLIGDLSGGQQQRVFIARALAGAPEVIFLDEPTVGVDVSVQEEFYNLLQRLNRKLGLTLVMVSHDIDVVANEATEILCINQTVVYHGTPEQFIKDDYMQKLYGKGVRHILHGH